MFTINKDQQSLFRREWENYVSRLTREKKSVPDMPSVGWLQEVAAKNNLCFVAGRIDDVDVVCGAELWKHPSDDGWMCAGCRSTQMRAYEKMKVA